MKTSSDMAQNECTFEGVLRLLAPHYHGLTGEETLNRLFRKHLQRRRAHLALFPPYLSHLNTVVTAETKPKHEFARLAQNLETHETRENTSIVIVRYRGEDQSMAITGAGFGDAILKRPIATIRRASS